ncbi:hypothetical protein ACWGCP_40825, partial [Streptomyces niveus]
PAPRGRDPGRSAMRMPTRRETVTAGPPPRLVVETGPTFPAWTARAAEEQARRAAEQPHSGPTW